MSGLVKSAVTSGEIIPESLDYKPKSFTQSSYRFHRTNQQQGPTSLTLSPSAVQPIYFQIPPRACNLSKSYLEFTMVADVNATYFTFMHLLALTFAANIQLQTGAGLNICENPFMAQYLNLIWGQEGRQDELKNLDPLLDYAGSAQWGCLLQPNNAVSVSAVAAKRANGTNADRFDEVAYLLTTGATGAGPTMQIQYPLGMCLNTVLEQDKVLYWGETMNLIVTFNSTNKMGFLSTSGTSPTNTGALAGVTISGLYLQLAVERNSDIEQALIAKYNSDGIRILTDYVYPYRLPCATTGQYTITQTFNRAMGQRLRRVYVAVYDATESGATTYIHDSSKMTQLITSMNARQLADNALVVANGDFWKQQKDRLNGKIAGYSQNIFNYNFAWCDSFEGDAERMVDSNNLICGLPLDTQQIYSAQASTVGNVILYLYAIVQRELLISRQGTMFL